VKRAPVVDVGTLPLLTFTRAMAFTGKSRSTLERAIRDELLAVAGRVGGRGERVFRRADVEAYLLGATAEPAPLAKREPMMPARAIPNVSAALERIRRAAAGGRS
jgi:hypothetical protein